MARRRHQHRVGACDDARWPEIAASLAPFIEDGATTKTIVERADPIMSATLALNVLAWMENAGQVVYNLDDKHWRLSSSGRRLANRMDLR